MKPLPLKVDDYPVDASLYVFDFCGTLFDSNTSLDFINWLAARKYIRLGNFLNTRVKAGLGRRLAGWSPVQHMKSRTKALTGIPTTLLESEAKAFVAEYLHIKRRPNETAFFHWCLDTGKKVVLLSFTYELLLEAFVDPLPSRPFLCLGSKLEIREDGRLSGMYHLQMHNYGKVKRLAEHADPNLIGQACFVTDDAAADHDLLEAVKYPFCVDLT